MSLDGAVDRQIVALCALADAAIDDVDGPMGERTVETVVGYPVPLTAIAQMQLPLLAVWRQRDDRVTLGNRTRQKSTIRIDYIMSATPSDAGEDRWPLMSRVWAKVTSAILAGRHAGLSNGADILTAADVVQVDETSPSVTYQTAPQQDDVYPGFVGSLVIYQRTDEEIAKLANRDTLHALLGLNAHYRLDTLTASEPDTVRDNLDV